MQRWATLGAMVLLAAGCAGNAGSAQSDGWISLFDGQLRIGPPAF